MRKTIFLFGTKGYLTPVLLTLLRSDWEVVGICGVPQQKKINGLRTKLGWFAREIGLVVDQDLIYQNPFAHLPEPFDIANANKIPTFNMTDFKNRAVPNYLSMSEPDLILAAGFPKLIPKHIYEKATLGAYNFHPSLLPDYKGSTPNRWVVKDGASLTGITAHRLTDKFDEGEIVLDSKIFVRKEDCWGDVEAKVIDKLPAFTIDFLNSCSEGTPAASPQPESAKELLPGLRGAKQFIDWRLPAEKISRLCQAMRPKSGGLALKGGLKICLWEFEPIVASTATQTYGAITDWPDNLGPIVSCGDGTLGRIVSVLYNQRIHRSNFLKKRFKISSGDCFDLVNFDN